MTTWWLSRSGWPTCWPGSAPSCSWNGPLPTRSWKRRRRPARSAHSTRVDRRSLIELGSIGYVRAIHARLDQIEEAEPARSRTVARLRQLVVAIPDQGVHGGARPGRAERRRAVNPIGTSREVVLVVDDSPATLGLLSEALERAGYTGLAWSACIETLPSFKLSWETQRRVTWGGKNVIPDLVFEPKWKAGSRC